MRTTKYQILTTGETVETSTAVATGRPVLVPKIKETSKGEAIGKKELASSKQNIGAERKVVPKIQAIQDLGNG